MKTAAPSRLDLEPADFMVGASAFLGGTANVIMQLALAPVGYGVVESKVDSGKVTLRPFKRTRTTLTYLSVAMLGNDEDRRAYRTAVNGAHRQVRSDENSPVQYNAFDPKLQQWVAACLYMGFYDTFRLMYGPVDDAVADALYREAMRLGTTLQLPADMWPADRAAFEQYWNGMLGHLHIDDTVREYLQQLVDFAMMPGWVRLPFGRFNRFVTTGYLPPLFRDQMQLDWSPRQQRRFERLMRTVGRTTKLMPRPIRTFPFNAYLWDMRRRAAAGRHLV